MAHSLGNIKPKQPKPFDAVKTVKRGEAPAKAKPNTLGMRNSRGNKK